MPDRFLVGLLLSFVNRLKTVESRRSFLSPSRLKIVAESRVKGRDQLRPAETIHSGVLIRFPLKASRSPNGRCFISVGSSFFPVFFLFCFSRVEK